MHLKVRNGQDVWASVYIPLSPGDSLSLVRNLQNRSQRQVQMRSKGDFCTMWTKHGFWTHGKGAQM